MKNATSIVLALLTFLLVHCASPTKINRGDVQSAEKLLGIEFSNREIDTMLTYLSGNRKGYDSMRMVKLKFTTAPALYFDPRPDHFVPKARPGQSDWKLVKEVSLPETDTQIAFLSVTELSALIKSGKITSTRLTQIYLFFQPI